MSQDDKSSSVKAILESLGIDTEKFSQEDILNAIGLISKYSAPKDIITQSLYKITAESMNLLLDAACERGEDSETMRLVKQGVSSMFKAWAEEEGEEKVGPVVCSFYVTFDERYRGSPEDLIQKGKDAVMWLIKDLGVESYLSEVSSYFSPAGEEGAEDGDDDLAPF